MDLKKISAMLGDLSGSKRPFEEIRKRGIRIIRKNTNQDLPFLSSIACEKKKDVNERLRVFYNNLNSMHCPEMIHDYLKCFLQGLVDIKLANLNGDKKKVKKRVRDLFLQKEFNFTKTLGLIEKNLMHIESMMGIYDAVLDDLSNSLMLEEGIEVLKTSIKPELKKLKKITESQREIALNIGKMVRSSV